MKKKSSYTSTKKSSRRQRPKARIPFWSTGGSELQTGLANVEIFRCQAMGQPVKIGKEIIPVKDCNEAGLADAILRAHGPGTYRLKRYNLKGTGCTTHMIQLAYESGPAAPLGGLTSVDTERIIKLEKQLAEFKAENSIRAARAEQIRAQTDMEKKRAELEIKIKERELEKLDERTSLEKLTDLVLENKNLWMPLLAAATQGALNGFTKTSPGGNGAGGAHPGVTRMVKKVLPPTRDAGSPRRAKD